MLVLLLLSGCSGDSDEQNSGRPTSSGAEETTTPAPSTDSGETDAAGPPGKGGPLSLKQFVTGLEAPVHATGAPGEPGRLYVV